MVPVDLLEFYLLQESFKLKDYLICGGYLLCFIYLLCQFIFLLLLFMSLINGVPDSIHSISFFGEQKEF